VFLAAEGARTRGWLGPRLYEPQRVRTSGVPGQLDRARLAAPKPRAKAGRRRESRACGGSRAAFRSTPGFPPH